MNTNSVYSTTWGNYFSKILPFRNYLNKTIFWQNENKTSNENTNSISYLQQISEKVNGCKEILENTYYFCTKKMNYRAEVLLREGQPKGQFHDVILMKTAVLNLAFVTNPEEITKILKENRTDPAKPYGGSAPINAIASILGTSKNIEHKKLHKHLTDFFSFRALAPYVNKLRTYFDASIDHWIQISSDKGQKKDFNISNGLKEMIIGSLCQDIFGFKKIDTEQAMKFSDDVTRIIKRRIIHQGLNEKELQQLKSRIRVEVDHIIDKEENPFDLCYNAGKKELGNSGDLEEEVDNNESNIQEDFNLVLALHKDGLDRSDITNIVALLFFAAQETTRSATEFAIQNLGTNTDWQMAILQEYQAELDALNENELDDQQLFNFLKKSKILDQILNETLRLNPPLYSQSRITNEDIIIGGISIPKGTWIQLSHYFAQRNTVIWGNDAETFDPSRFSSLNKSEVLKRMKPFAIGENRCVGQGLAELEIKMILLLLTLKTTWKSTKTDIAQNGSITLSLAEDVLVDFEPYPLSSE